MIRLRARAQAMVENAIVLPVFLMLTIGAVDFARAAWAYNTVAFLAREGARYGAVPSRSTADIQNSVIGRCSSLLSNSCSLLTPPAPGGAAISVTRGTCGITSAPAVVTVRYEFQAATLMLANLWGGGTLPMQATSQMYVELGPAGGCAT